MILHTLNKPSSYESLCHQLSENIARVDSVILIEDGVYQITWLEHHSLGHWSTIANKIYALKDDVIARGTSDNADYITYIDYPEFVALTLSHTKVISWY